MESLVKCYASFSMAALKNNCHWTWTLNLFKKFKVWVQFQSSNSTGVGFFNFWSLNLNFEPFLFKVQGSKVQHANKMERQSNQWSIWLQFVFLKLLIEPHRFKVQALQVQSSRFDFRGLNLEIRDPSDEFSKCVSSKI